MLFMFRRTLQGLESQKIDSNMLAKLLTKRRDTEGNLPNGVP